MEEGSEDMCKAEHEKSVHLVGEERSKGRKLIVKSALEELKAAHE